LRLKQLTLVPEKVIACFDYYLALEGKPITRAMAERRMLEKLTRSLTEDITPLLPVGIQFGELDAIHAFERVWIELIARMGGEAKSATSLWSRIFRNSRAASSPERRRR